MATNYCENCRTKYSAKQQKEILSEAIPEVKCAVCKSVRSFYSIPIAVLLQPVVTAAGETGLLVRRQGKISSPLDKGIKLPSCFFHTGGDTRQILIRETGIDINPDTLRSFGIRTAPFDQYVSLFLVNETVLYEKDLLLFLNDETDERRIITEYENEEFLLPYEREMVKEFFDELWFNEPDR